MGNIGAVIAQSRARREFLLELTVLWSSRRGGLSRGFLFGSSSAARTLNDGRRLVRDTTNNVRVVLGPGDERVGKVPRVLLVR